MAFLGSVEKFNMHEDNWLEYVERVQQFFVANDITTDEKKRGVLLTVIGSETYSLLRNLLLPLKPSELSFAQIIEVLKNHLNPKPIVIAERYKFYQPVYSGHPI